ncbi:hypothetical protein FQN55_008909 [Onygenales sp. PD_40]|nr:hypothetical protein FQN55_008909 [Onygenales sp. PD_40]
MSVPPLSTAPESQFLDVEWLSQFDIVAFIEDEEELVEQLAEWVEQVESQFFIQNDEYEEDIDEDVGDSVDFNEPELDDDFEPLTPEPVPMGDHSEIPCQLPKLTGHTVQMMNKELVQYLNLNCRYSGYAITNFCTDPKNNCYMLGCNCSGTFRNT